jgi:hypothetical protein
MITASEWAQMHKIAIDWSDIDEYETGDDNNGFVYGVEYYVDEGLQTGSPANVQWFNTEEKRDAEMRKAEDKEWVSTTPEQAMKDVREAIKWAEEHTTKNGYKRETHPVLYTDGVNHRAGIQTVKWYVYDAFTNLQDSLDLAMSDKYTPAFIESGHVECVVKSYNFGVKVSVKRNEVRKADNQAKLDKVAAFRKEVFDKPVSTMSAQSGWDVDI